MLDFIKPLMFRCLVVAIGFLPIHSTIAGIYDDILAAANKDETSQVIDLIKRGMDVNTTDSSGNTLLMIAARNNNEKLLDFLLKNRANTLKQNKVGDSAIMLAAFRGHTAAVRRLLETGPQQRQGGWNALHYAAYAGHEEVVRMLVVGHPDLDGVAPNGQTALILAASAGHLGITRHLVEAGAKLGTADFDGKTALARAIQNNHPDVARALEIAGASR